MFLKALTLHSIFYVVGASSILAAHHMVASPPARVGFRSDVANKTEIFSTQVVNRSLKGNKLPIKQSTPNANVKELVKVPAKIAPKKGESDCRPYSDVRGRCFADAKPNRRTA